MHEFKTSGETRVGRGAIIEEEMGIVPMISGAVVESVGVVSHGPFVVLLEQNRPAE
ncbi:MAG TPA: hypothetical protein VGL62_05795 [Vicinamibacterales bacterium]